MLRQIMTLVAGLGLQLNDFAAADLPAPKVLAPSLTFAEYAAENGANPALSRRVPGHQTAFIDFSKSAIITMPAQYLDDDSAIAGSAAPSERAPASLGTPVVAPAGDSPGTAPSASSGSGPTR